MNSRRRISIPPANQRSLPRGWLQGNGVTVGRLDADKGIGGMGAMQGANGTQRRAQILVGD
jgi:hypothetical protein